MHHYQRINFHSEDVTFELSEEEGSIKDWIDKIIKEENCQLKRLNYIFCSDEYLYKVNMEYLQHDTYTDIITFPYSYEPIESDMFISIDRISDNAKQLKTSFESELYRVIIHGVLHLVGYDDKTEEKKKEMRNRENRAISYLNTLI